jgi:hypothetical protein
MHPKGSSPGIQRPTLIRFLRKIAAADGLMRVELFQLHMNKTSGFWNTIRDTPYPKGLHGLVVEEKCHNDDFGTNHPVIRKWFIRSVGRKFLANVLCNPDAMPPANIKTERKLISEDARLLQREERRESARHRRNLEKLQRSQRHPKHRKAEYSEPPEHADVDINSPEFRRLSSLERIRILRAQKHQSESFFYSELVNDWSEAEWAKAEACWNPNRKTKPPKPTEPEPVVLPEPPKPQPLKSTLDEIAEAQAKIRAGMSEAELLEHQKRVDLLLGRK